LRQFGLDGILGQEKYLLRENLVNTALDMLKNDRFLLISSPPATGKTSLLQILGTCHFHQYEYLRCRRSTDPYQVLKSIGLDLTTEKFQINGRKLIVFLDDAQNIYQHDDFWTVLIKEASSRCPFFKFIISATHNLNDSLESPMVLQSLTSRIDRSLMLLTGSDIEELFDILDVGSFAFKDFPTARQVISNEASGVVGAIVISVRKIFWKLRDYRSMEESQILQYFYSKEFSSELGRLFGADRDSLIVPELRFFLSDCFLCPARKPNFNDLEARKLLNILVKGGVLVETGDFYSFSSALAKRFYIQKIFPARATDVPADVRTLVVLAIQRMSANSLKLSTGSTDDFPKEAVLRHQFMAGLLASLPIECYVCPELSKDFSQGNHLNELTEGEMDLYVNGNLRWGIQLLVNGDGISQHVSRFAEPHGKYIKLRPKDFVVVDFRCSHDGNPTNVIQTEKRMSVFFRKGDFSKCTYKYELDPETYILNLDS
jgi:hypothetical protein